MVVGGGSIGLRHLRVLEALGLEVALVSRRTAPGPVDAGAEVFAGLAPALASFSPDHVVIATETSDHLRVLEGLATTGYSGSVLVEKPLTQASAAIPDLPFRTCAVGYQLRMHPVVMEARASLVGRHVLAVHAHVGQHLSSWRPGRGVEDSASARVGAGGGALRDLSHEIDLVLWLIGGWRRLCALGGRSGALGPGVETDDRWAILLELQNGAIVTINLDMLDHVGQRRMTVVTDALTIALDLVAGTLTTGTADAGTSSGDGGCVQRWVVDRDVVLADLHRAVLDGRSDLVCSVDEGLAVVVLIEAAERSVAERRWVSREEYSGATA
jgi:predicted dehydrogenase